MNLIQAVPNRNDVRGNQREVQTALRKSARIGWRVWGRKNAGKAKVSLEDERY